MGKYEPLTKHLEGVRASRVTMSFEEIEGILGFPLPPSSVRHRGWWSNNPLNNVMTRAWLDAGFESEAVDLERRRLVFRRTGTVPSDEKADSAQRSGRHPFLGCMKGTVWIAPDVDLTAPADPEWGARAYGEGA